MTTATAASPVPAGWSPAQWRRLAYLAAHGHDAISIAARLMRPLPLTERALQQLALRALLASGVGERPYRDLDASGAPAPAATGTPRKRRRKRGNTATYRGKLYGPPAEIEPEPTILDELAEILGDRYRYHRGDLFLDGRPASVGDLVQAARELGHTDLYWPGVAPHPDDRVLRP